ncbi:hypothetical protein QYM36_014431, partial [Artemia franciscana]
MVQFTKDASWPCRVLDIILAKNKKNPMLYFVMKAMNIVTTTASQLSSSVSISKQAKKKNDLGPAAPSSTTVGAGGKSPTTSGPRAGPGSTVRQ